MPKLHAARTACLLLLAGVPAIAPVQAAAQSASAGAGGEARTDVRVNLTGTYDNNVSRSNSLVASQRGLAQQDWIFQPAVILDLARPISRQSVFLTGSVGYDFYQRNSILNRERIDLTGGSGLQLGGCEGVLSAGYGRHQSQLQDLQLLSITQSVETTQTYRFSGDCARPIGFSPTFSVSHSQTDNSLPLLKTANHRTEGATAGLMYARPTLGTVQLYGEFDQTEYQNRLLPDGNGGLRHDGYKSYAAVVSYDRRVGSRLEATLQASYMILKPDVGGGGGLNTINYKVLLTARPTSRLEADLDVEEGASAPNRIGVSYSRDRSVQGQLKYRVGSRMTVGGGGFWQEHRYSGANVVPGVIVTQEHVNGFFASSELNVGRRLRLVLDCRQEKRTADIAAFGYDDLRVSLTAATKF